MGRPVSFSHPWRAMEGTEEPFVPSVAKLAGRDRQKAASYLSCLTRTQSGCPLSPSGLLPFNEFLLGNTGHKGTSATSWLSLWAIVLC